MTQPDTTRLAKEAAEKIFPRGSLEAFEQLQGMKRQAAAVIIADAMQRLMLALMPYVRHRPECPVSANWETKAGVGFPCTCGLEALGSSADPCCDCGAKLTQCTDCAIGEYQGLHPDCPQCCMTPEQMTGICESVKGPTHD